MLNAAAQQCLSKAPPSAAMSNPNGLQSQKP